LAADAAGKGWETVGFFDHVCFFNKSSLITPIPVGSAYVFTTFVTVDGGIRVVCPG
jgi:hypothetical protein